MAANLATEARTFIDLISGTGQDSHMDDDARARLATNFQSQLGTSVTPDMLAKFNTELKKDRDSSLNFNPGNSIPRVLNAMATDHANPSEDVQNLRTAVRSWAITLSPNPRSDVPAALGALVPTAPTVPPNSPLGTALNGLNNASNFPSAPPPPPPPNPLDASAKLFITNTGAGLDTNQSQHPQYAMTQPQFDVLNSIAKVAFRDHSVNPAFLNSFNGVFGQKFSELMRNHAINPNRALEMALQSTFNDPSIHNRGNTQQVANMRQAIGQISSRFTNSEFASTSNHLPADLVRGITPPAPAQATVRHPSGNIAVLAMTTTDITPPPGPAVPLSPQPPPTPPGVQPATRLNDARLSMETHGLPNIVKNGAIIWTPQHPGGLGISVEMNPHEQAVYRIYDGFGHQQGPDLNESGLLSTLRRQEGMSNRQAEGALREGQLDVAGSATQQANHSPTSPVLTQALNGNYTAPVQRQQPDPPTARGAYVALFDDTAPPSGTTRAALKAADNAPAAQSSNKPAANTTAAPPRSFAMISNGPGGSS